MPTGIPDPSYYPPALDFIVGVPPAPTITDLGGGLSQVAFQKSKIQTALWNYLQINKHYVVNLQKVSAGLIKAKSSDATKYYLQAQHDVANVWANGDPLVPQTHQFFLHISNLKIASKLARERDYVLGWRDDGTWGVLKQSDDYTAMDASALDIQPGEDLDANSHFDVQRIIATGKAINICRSGTPRDPMNGLSDNVPPLQVQRNVVMTTRQAIDLYEEMTAAGSGE
jgi:hypothetical protein